MNGSTRRAVLLDRDGTINVDRHYLSRPEQLELLPRAAEGLRRMQSLGLPLIVVSNQSGVGRGYFDHAALQRVHDRFIELLRSEGVELAGLLVCPHAPDDNCRCRKPRPGLVEQAQRELGIDPRRSYVIGDKPSDLQLGRNVGSTTVWVRAVPSDEPGLPDEPAVVPRAIVPARHELADAEVAHLAAAAEFIEWHVRAAWSRHFG